MTLSRRRRHSLFTGRSRLAFRTLLPLRTLLLLRAFLAFRAILARRTTLPRVMPLARARRGVGFGRRRGLARPFDRLSDELLDRRHRLAVDRRHDGQRGAETPGAAGAADAMHVIVGVMRHVEIEDMAHGRNIET